MTTGFVFMASVGSDRRAKYLPLPALNTPSGSKGYFHSERCVTTARSWQMWLVGGALIGAILLVAILYSPNTGLKDTKTQCRDQLKRCGVTFFQDTCRTNR